MTPPSFRRAAALAALLATAACASQPPRISNGYDQSKQDVASIVHGRPGDPHGYYALRRATPERFRALLAERNAEVEKWHAERPAREARDREVAALRQAQAGCRAQAAAAAYFDDAAGTLEQILVGSSRFTRQVRGSCEAWHRAYGTPGF